MQGYPLYSRKERATLKQKTSVKCNEREYRCLPGTRGAWSTLNIQLAELAAAEVSGQAFSDRERDALACVESVAKSLRYAADLQSGTGDVLFINNLAVMHRRDKYHDGQDEAQKRMLYRMWINLHQAQPVVAQHQHCGGVSVVESGYRCGLVLPLVTHTGVGRADRRINPGCLFNKSLWRRYE